MNWGRGGDQDERGGARRARAGGGARSRRGRGGASRLLEELAEPRFLEHHVDLLPRQPVGADDARHLPLVERGQPVDGAGGGVEVELGQDLRVRFALLLRRETRGGTPQHLAPSRLPRARLGQARRQLGARRAPLLPDPAALPSPTCASRPSRRST